MSLSAIGRAAIAYVEHKDSNGNRTTLATWRWLGRDYRRTKDGRANQSIGNGVFINCQTGEVLREGHSVEALFAEQEGQ